MTPTRSTFFTEYSKTIGDIKKNLIYYRSSAYALHAKYLIIVIILWLNASESLSGAPRFRRQIKITHNNIVYTKHIRYAHMGVYFSFVDMLRYENQTTCTHINSFKNIPVHVQIMIIITVTIRVPTYFYNLTYHNVLVFIILCLGLL